MIFVNRYWINRESSHQVDRIINSLYSLVKELDIYHHKIILIFIFNDKGQTTSQSYEMTEGNT